jgi:uroporphyrinogen-III synthase
VLIFRAQEARDVLPAALIAAGVTVEDVAAYRTSAATPADFGGKLSGSDVITFTSASTVAAFVKSLGAGAAQALRQKTVACIGPVTAQAARDAGLRVDVIANEYTVEGLLDALEDRFASTASASPR